MIFNRPQDAIVSPLDFSLASTLSSSTRGIWVIPWLLKKNGVVVFWWSIVWYQKYGQLMSI